LSSGNSTLGRSSQYFAQGQRNNEARCSREALDKGEFVLDLAAVRLGLVLRLLELVGRGVLLERDLVSVSA
jgi:hypothetical protein